MPSPFDAIDAVMQSHVDRLYGEGVRLIPMVGDNYTGRPDPDRPERANVRATVARAPTTAMTRFRGTSRNGAAMATSPTEIWIDREAYAAIGFQIVRGDVIELSADAHKPRFSVAAVHEGDHGDVQIILG